MTMQFCCFFVARMYLRNVCLRNFRKRHSTNPKCYSAAIVRLVCDIDVATCALLLAFQFTTQQYTKVIASFWQISCRVLAQRLTPRNADVTGSSSLQCYWLAETLNSFESNAHFFFVAFSESDKSFNAKS